MPLSPDEKNKRAMESTDAYKVLYQAKGKFWRDNRFTVSYKKVFLMEEVLIIILAGSLRLGAEQLAYDMI